MTEKTTRDDRAGDGAGDAEGTGDMAGAGRGRAGVNLSLDAAHGTALVTLDRPHRLNAIDLDTAGQLTRIWGRIRSDDSVRAVVLTGAGDRAFCTGIDRDARVPQPSSPFSTDDPLLTVGPKSNDCWKPVIAAVNGMACGGAFYLLGEADFLIADDHATFFDPHTTYGMVSAYESVLMAQRMPYGEVSRMALMGNAERISAETALRTGLVSEVTQAGGALPAAEECARVLASYPAHAVQGTVRALWSARETARSHAYAQAPHLIALGNLPPEQQTSLFTGRRGEFRMR